MKKFCKDLRKHATKIINYKKKKNDTINNKTKKYHNKQKRCYICKKEFDISNENHHKVSDHCHYTGEYSFKEHTK